MPDHSTRSAAAGPPATVLDALDGSIRRLRELVSLPAADRENLAEVVAIYNNAAFVHAYAEGNRPYFPVTDLLTSLESLFDDPELRASTLSLLSRVRCADQSAAEVGREWITWLSSVGPAASGDAEASALRSAADRIPREWERAQDQLLRRLGMRTGPGSSAVLFQRAVNNIADPTVRRKATQVWYRQRDQYMGDLTEVMDRIVAVRRSRASALGFATVLDQTIARCGVSEQEASTFLRGYLAQALDRHAELVADVAQVTGCAEEPMDHFGHYLKTSFKGARLPVFGLEPCLDFLGTIVRRVFGVVLRRVDGARPGVIAMTAGSADRDLGTVYFDLLDNGERYEAGRAPGVPSPGSPVRPAGRVLCRLHTGTDGTRLLTFESAHSVFHEFGHALNHLLLRRIRPGRTGMDYLPLERIEDLSAWFEKWVYHQDFAAHLGLASGEAAGMETCRRVKKLEFLSTAVERAVVALVDLDVHRRADGGLREAYRRLDAEFGVSAGCDYGAVPIHFTWPMFRSNPGANFAYIWGAAFGAQTFAPFLDRAVSSIRSPDEFSDVFRSCFDRGEPSSTPDVQALFDFYDSVPRRQDAT